MKTRFLIIALILVLTLALTPAASAASLAPIDPNGESIDLDGDGVNEWIELSVVYDEYDTGVEYTLTVGGASARGTGYELNGKIHLLDLGEGSKYLMVSEDGPSDDPIQYLYYYANGALYSAGWVASWAHNIEPTENGFTGVIRDDVLQTWFRPAEFRFSTSLAALYGESETNSCIVYQVPIGTYAIGSVVTALRDVPLYAQRPNAAPTLTLEAGSRAILAATDSDGWVRIDKLATDDCGRNYTEWSGWLRYESEFGMEIDIENEQVFSGELFDGLAMYD